jgi:hypothetical protein
MVDVGINCHHSVLARHCVFVLRRRASEPEKIAGFSTHLWGSTMDIEKLAVRYFQLKQDLSIAYNSQPWNSRIVDHLANEIARTEQEIAALKPEGVQVDNA